MSAKSSIEWTDATWNPIRARNKATGKIGWHCVHKSPGCGNCYAESLNKRLGTGFAFKPGHEKDIEIFLDEKMLLAPLRWKKPRMIFVCSMTDLFADFVKDEWIDKIFAAMALAPHHTFQVLTKRSARMRLYIEAVQQSSFMDHLIAFGEQHKVLPKKLTVEWPLRNIWLGVSAEGQAQYDERSDDLFNTAAAVQFFSLEPLLGPIIGDWFGDWAIVGGESGPSARPMHPDWARWIRDQCAEQGTAFFFKQWGEWAPGENADGPLRRTEQTADWFNDRWSFNQMTPSSSEGLHVDDEPDAYRMGKKAAGRLLDGIEHNAIPEQPNEQARANDSRFRRTSV